MESKKHNSEAKSSDTNSSQEVMKTRLMYAIACVLGKKGKVRTRSGGMYEGHLYTMTSDGCVFKECSSNQGLEPSLNLARDDFITLEFNNIQPVQHRKFKTDAEISKRKSLQDRELQKWEPEEDGHGLTLEDVHGSSWDQFKINEQKFGVRTTYDEHLYTTKVPHASELTEAEVRRAEKLAKELEGGKDDYNEDEDEEAKYGAVLGTGRYKDIKRKSKKFKKKREDKEIKNSKSSPFKESNINSTSANEILLQKNTELQSSLDKEQQNPLKSPSSQKAESSSTTSTQSGKASISEPKPLPSIDTSRAKVSDSIFKPSDDYRRSESFPSILEDHKEVSSHNTESRFRTLSYVTSNQAESSSPALNYNPLAQEFTVIMTQPSGVDTIIPFFSKEPPKHLIEYYLECWKKIQEEVKSSRPSIR
jgi:hypothetical protein